MNVKRFIMDNYVKKIINAKFPTLYTKDISGSIRFWYIELNLNNKSQYRTVSGIFDGVEIRSAWTQVNGKNSNKINATTDEIQTLLDIESLYRQKISSKYYENFDEVGGHKFCAPMLAHKFESWDKLNKSEKIFVQPKLDGFRCIASIDGLTSRQGKKFYIPHIMKVLYPLFEQEPNLILDGELYNHDLKDDFNALGSLVKKVKRSLEEDYKLCKMVQYHVYDSPTIQSKFAERIDKIKTLFQLYIQDTTNIKLVETIEIISENEFNDQYSNLLSQGYEGIMVRLNKNYEIGKRSKSLLKHKDFFDCEVELIDVKEGIGNWANYAKTALIRLPNGLEQSSGMRGDQEFLKQILLNKNMYGLVTVRYQNKTPEGYLRFPIIVDWHEGNKRNY